MVPLYGTLCINGSLIWDARHKWFPYMDAMHKWLSGMDTPSEEHSVKIVLALSEMVSALKGNILLLLGLYSFLSE